MLYFIIRYLPNILKKVINFVIKPRENAPAITAENLIYRDSFFVAVNKPEGLLVHPSFIDKNEKESVMKQLRDLIGQWVYPIHRLDRPTSGALIFGLSSEAASGLGEYFSRRQVSKTYLAVVRGFTAPHGIIDRPLKEIWDKMTDRESSRNKEAQDALTEFDTLENVELPIAIPPHPTSRYSLVKVRPHTGRQRQIRRHFKSIFHPIIGDPKHGDGNHNRMFRERFGLYRLMLHSYSLEFIHPFTGEPTTIIAELPQSFAAVATNAGFNLNFLSPKD